jgi:ABC-type Mn2+/Zn2+ transport system ATPase subunit
MKESTKPADSTRLTCQALQVGYGTSPLLPAFDMQVCAGEVWALVGRNGSGKSTLLRTLLGELRPVTGRYSVTPDASLAHVAQRGSHDLCVPARAWDMVEGGVDRGWGFLRWRGREALVRRALSEVGAEALAKEPFAHLSEGQKQRILMARALASGPDVLLLDEPTSAMDPMAEREIFDLIDALRVSHGLAVIIASHSMAVLPAIATHVVFLDRDDQIALTGERCQVLSDPRFQARYGKVVPTGDAS